ncbi:MAG TPA: ATP-binding cassette domain-containing protein, partial [Pedococcus sp.]|nr:ATP-binding cassette domain-containing protein [Pedococcus sp.]
MSLRADLTVGARGVDLELSVADGQTLAVLGPNGAGKSTVLAAIAGLVRPDAGRIRLGDRVLFAATAPPTWVPPHDRGVALLAQEPRLFPHLSALDNVAFGPRSSGMPRAEARARARHWL